MGRRRNFGAIALLTLTASVRAQSPAGFSGQNLSAAPEKPSAATPQMAPVLPASPTTSLPAASLAAPTTANTRATGRRAHVDYAGGMVTITASNSSLNQILREIARLSGIRITGGVTDERVYGSYGPLDLPHMLAMLLDGTGTNMMLSGDQPGQPQLLTLTPRQGGPSPPSPQQAGGNDEADASDENLTPQQVPRPVQPGNAPAPSDVLLPPAAPSTPAAATGNTQPAAATTTEQSPNGVKTPQQIYDQLMKLQQQSQKTPQ